MAVRTGYKLGEQIRRDRNATRRTVLLDENSTSDNSPVFEVIDTPLVLQLYGATGSQTVEVWTVYSDSVEAQFLLNGVPLFLNQSNNVILLETSGKYRVKVTDGGRLGLTCTAHKQTVDQEPDEIPQPSGVQANKPNLFLRETGVAPDTNILEIIDKPWLFTAYGLQAGEYIETLVIYGRGASYREELFLFNGVPQVLTPINTSIVLSKAGRYRFRLTGSLLDKILVGNPTSAVSGSGDTGGGVVSILAGTGIEVNAINPFSPIVSLAASAITSLALADTAIQPGANITLLNNNAGYLAPGANITLLNNNAGYLAPGANISLLNNDVGYSIIPNTDALSEGATNKYFTDARARNAVLATAIVDGDTTHAPDGNTVFDAITGINASIGTKADKSLLLIAGTGLTGGGNLSADRTFNIANTTVVAGAYGSATHSPTYTVNAQGQLTIATDVLITPDFGDVQNLPTTLAGYGITDAALDSTVVHKAGTEIITGEKTFTADTLVAKTDAVIGIGISSTLNGGLANYAAAGSGDIGVFSEHVTGRVRLRPNGRLSSVGEVVVDTTSVQVGTQSGGAVGILRLEASGGARQGFTNTGVRRYSIGNNGSSFTIRDESGVADRLTILSGGAASFSGGLTVPSLTVAGGNIVGNGGTHSLQIYQPTSDAADTARLVIMGGGAISNTRGAYLQVHGNEYASSPGLALLTSGLGADVRIIAPSAEISLEDDVVLSQRIRGTALHNNASGMAGGQFIGSGTYTPTFTALANVDATTAFAWQYIRVGNVVHMCGAVDVDPTTAGVLTRVGVTLPIASNISTQIQAMGVGSRNAAGAVEHIMVIGEAVNDRLELHFYPTTNTNARAFITATYQVI